MNITSKLVKAMLCAFGSMLVGAAIPWQGRANLGLGQVLGSSLYATLFSLLTSAMMVLSVPSFRRKAWELLTGGHMRWWEYGVGFPGALYITLLPYSIPLAGMFMMAVCATGGQMLGSLLVSWKALKGRWPRAICSAFLATAAATLTRLGLPVGNPPHWLLPVIVVSAASIVVQLWLVKELGQRKLASGKSSVWAAAAVSSISGVAATILMIGIAALHGDSLAVSLDLSQLSPLDFTGGILGVVIITGSAVLAPQLANMLLYMLYLTLGYLFGSLTSEGSLLVKMGAIILMGLVVIIGESGKRPKSTEISIS